MSLSLIRPIIFFDIEATGLDPVKDRIVQLTLIKVYPDGTEELRDEMINPGCLIPKESSAIHGIFDEDVANCPTFAELARSLHHFLHGADLSGYNLINYDIPILMEEFFRAGIFLDTSHISVVDVFQIFRMKEPKTLQKALEFYCGEKLENAHNAKADIIATQKVLYGQLRMYQDLLPTPEALSESCTPDYLKNKVDWGGKFIWQNNEAVINFGQHSGKSLKVMVQHESGYLTWMLNKDFSSHVKHIIQQALKGNFPER